MTKKKLLKKHRRSKEIKRMANIVRNNPKPENPDKKKMKYGKRTYT